VQPLREGIRPYVFKQWLNLPLGDQPPHCAALAQHTDRPAAYSIFYRGQDLPLAPEAAGAWTLPAGYRLPRPPYQVKRVKAEGKTPGFFIEDDAGVGYLIKLDPVDYPGLLSGAEVIASRLLHALGYRVPFYTAINLRLNELRWQDDVQRAQWEPLLQAREQAGRIRAVASLLVPGKVLGPARFEDFGCCRDMRALRFAYAWLNNTDAKSHNSLLVEIGGRRIGYLIDFGSALGADAGRAGPKDGCSGWRSALDARGWIAALTPGRGEWGCGSSAVYSRSAGNFSEAWDPLRWVPYIGNGLFEQASTQDAQWLAQRLWRVNERLIRAVVEEAAYAQRADTEYLIEVLVNRRAAFLALYPVEANNDLTL
jgi:hypothetical protein